MSDLTTSGTTSPIHWLYILSEPHLWTVGFHSPDGTWVAESDHDSPGKAAERVNFLNGGKGDPGYTVAQVVEVLQKTYCLEIDDFTEFLTWVNNGKTPAESYIKPKFETLRKNPGMFLCQLDPGRGGRFMEWLLAR